MLKRLTTIWKARYQSTIFAMLLIGGVFVNSALAADRYWVGSAGGSTNATANWSASSGNACGVGGGASVPGSSDIARFTSDCTNNATVDATLTVSGLDIQAGYSGTITQNASIEITVGTDDFIIADGAFTGSDALIDINGSFGISGGTFTAGTQTIHVDDNWIASGGTFTASSSEIMFTSTDAATITTNSQSFNHMMINDGLVGYWKFDNTTGPGLDSSGFDNTATLNNGSSLVTSNMAPVRFHNPRSVHFDGSNDYVDAGSADELDNIFSGGGTVTAWIYATGYGENGLGRIVNKASSTIPDDGYVMHVRSASTSLAFARDFTTTNGIWYSPTASISLNTWYHVAFVYDDTSASNDPLIYIDGVSQTVTESSTPAGSAVTDAGQSVIIGNDANTVRTFSGQIDDVRIYNRTLSASEIALLAKGVQPALAMGTFTLQDALDVNGTLTLNAGELNTGSNQRVTASGSWENNGGVFTVNSSDVVFDGTASDHIILTGSMAFDDIDFIGSGTWMLHDDMIVNGGGTLNNGTLTYTTDFEPMEYTGSLTVDGGTFTGTATDFVQDGRLTITSGIYTAPSANLTVNENFIHSAGTFTNNSGTIIFTNTNGTAPNLTGSTAFHSLTFGEGLVGYWKIRRSICRVYHH